MTQLVLILTIFIYILECNFFQNGHFGNIQVLFHNCLLKCNLSHFGIACKICLHGILKYDHLFIYIMLLKLTDFSVSWLLIINYN